MKILNALILLFTLSLATSLNAAEIFDDHILIVKDSGSGTYFDLYLEVNEENEALGLKMYDRDVGDWVEWDVGALREGVTLRQESGFDVIILQSNDFNPSVGGNFQVIYLYSGLSGRQERFPITIEKVQGEWSVFHGERGAELLDFKMNKLFGKVIGIKNVVPSYY